MSFEGISSGLLALAGQGGAVLLGCVGLGFLIAFHEFGHFIFCKLFGVRTPTFSVGFGPRLIERKIGDTVFTLSLIPLGGFVEIAGHEEVGQGDQAHAQLTGEGSFASISYLKKMAIMSGGILCNVLFAYGALIVLARIGLPASPLLYPDNAQPVIATISPDSPAEKAGLKPHDRIISISASGEHTEGAVLALLAHIKRFPSTEQRLLIERNGVQQELVVTLGEREHCGMREGVLGAIFEMSPEMGHPWAGALLRAHDIIVSWTHRTAQTFRSMWERKSLDGVGGPLAVIAQTIKGAKSGFASYVLLLAFISLSLALMNLIPVPVFDGGQALLVTIEALIRRKLPESIRVAVHYATWVLLLGFMLYITYCDLRSLKAFWLIALVPVGYLVSRWL